MKTEPINLPARIAPAVASHRDMEKLTRLLTRMRVWECPCCGEWYPPERNMVFGVCVDCFDGNENAEDHFVLPKSDHDIKAMYLKLWRSVAVYDCFGPHAVRKQGDRPQLEWDMLQVLWSVESERLKALLPKVLYLDAFRWTKDGFMPVGFNPPDASDKVAWGKLRDKIFFRAKP